MSGSNKVQLSASSLETLEAQTFWGAIPPDDSEEESAPAYDMPYAWRAAAGWP
jgi:hypothetical protein